MKTLRYNVSATRSEEILRRMLDEYKMIGYDARMIDGELVVYYGKQHRKTKKQQEQEQSERWSKRERNYGFARK